MPIKPDRLAPGDTVGIVAPASAPSDPRVIDQSIARLEELGFRVKVRRHIRKRLGFLAGDDRQRADDLMRMFSDRQVKGIFCVRGGYGTARLMDRLDYRIIARHPKIFVGYSDITSLHCAFLKKAGLVSFHGPMLASDLVKRECPKFTIQSLRRTLMEAEAPGSICAGYRRYTVKTLRRGAATGRLLGGNLSLLCTLVGTPFQPVFRDTILFLEDLDEPPYRFDRMLTHLLNAGLLQQVAGVAVGLCANCEDTKARRMKEYRQTLEDVLVERLSPLKVPVVMGLPFGHVPPNATVPVGVRATLNANRGDLSIVESAVV